MATVRTENYAQAKARIFAGLRALGWTVKTDLKRPQARPPRDLNRSYVLRFHAQAVYLNSHTLWLDYRDLPVAEFIATVERWRSE